MLVSIRRIIWWKVCAPKSSAAKINFCFPAHTGRSGGAQKSASVEGTGENQWKQLLQPGWAAGWDRGGHCSTARCETRWFLKVFFSLDFWDSFNRKQFCRNLQVWTFNLALDSGSALKGWKIRAVLFKAIALYTSCYAVSCLLSVKASLLCLFFQVYFA